MVVIVVLVTAIKNKVSPVVLVKKGLPTLLIAITTASSAASFGMNVNACEKKYGIDKSVVDFGIPLGMVMYKPATAMGYLSFAFYFAGIYHVECSPAWVLITIIVVGVTAIATPPIPGGTLTAYTIIFSQLGIPLEALAVALTVDVLTDFISTGFNQFILPFALINKSGKIGRLDKKILHSNKY